MPTDSSKLWNTKEEKEEYLPRSGGIVVLSRRIEIQIIIYNFGLNILNAN
jgi:hypothetical protein